MDAIDFGIYSLFVLFVVAIAGLILMEVFNLLKDPKSLIKVGIGLVGVVIFFFIAYSVSVGDVKAKYIAYGVTEGSSRLIGAGLIMLYVTFIVAAIGAVISEIYKLMK